jgi:hypothetical protein
LSNLKRAKGFYNRTQMSRAKLGLRLSINIFHHPDVSALGPETIEEDPPSIR